MTWGTLRLLLQSGAAAGVSLDLIDEALNARYEQVFQATDWMGLHAHATIQTLAAYESGSDTVTATVGSATITGVGTAWGGEWAGRRFFIPGDAVYYTILAVGAVAELTLERPYEGTGADPAGTVYAGRSYVVMQQIYALPTNCVAVVTLLDPNTGLPLKKFSQEELDRSVGQRPRIGDPTCWAVYDDSEETASPVVHQVEIAPAPKFSRGIPLEYVKSAVGFDGSSTNNSPLPWVSSAVLLAGARADIAMHLAAEAAKANNSVAAAFHSRAVLNYETKFQEELARMVKVDHQQRRTPTAMRMAPRFTRHRLARVRR